VLEQVLEVLRSDEERAVVLTDLETGEQRLLRDGTELERGRSRLVEREGRKLFADVYGPPPQLLVYGAVDTAEALCRAARGIGWRTVVADARAKFATPDRIPSAAELVVGWPDEVLARVAPDHATAVVVLTHDDRFDVPALAGGLESDAFYVGAIGSRRNQARRRERLLEAGVPEEAVDRISGLSASTSAPTRRQRRRSRSSRRSSPGVPGAPGGAAEGRAGANPRGVPGRVI
jgi:xanthine/CO dehydrogenase XdhC/CoxF family maturation factor